MCYLDEGLGIMPHFLIAPSGIVLRWIHMSVLAGILCWKRGKFGYYSRRWCANTRQARAARYLDTIRPQGAARRGEAWRGGTARHGQGEAGELGIAFVLFTWLRLSVDNVSENTVPAKIMSPYRVSSRRFWRQYLHCLYIWSGFHHTCFLCESWKLKRKYVNAWILEVE